MAGFGRAKWNERNLEQAREICLASSKTREVIISTRRATQKYFILFYLCYLQKLTIPLNNRYRYFSDYGHHFKGMKTVHFKEQAAQLFTLRKQIIRSKNPQNFSYDCK